MRYNFDKKIQRDGTNSLKWEFILDGDRFVQRKYSENYPPGENILPMWVADMDFPVPKPVVDALGKRAKHGIFGYSAPTDEYFMSLVNWMNNRHDWQISPEWISTAPGIVPALNMLVRTFVSPGEKVLIQPPVYHPFFNAVTNNNAQLVFNPLRLDNGRYMMDFDDLREKAMDHLLSVAILCSPHNPVGRVWTEQELTEFGEICLENGIIVISDEIHCDLVLNDNRFVPFGRINEAFAQNSIICTAPSKTFNLAGLKTSNLIIPNQTLRTRFISAVERSGIFGVNAFGLVAMQAAYEEGEEWLDQVLIYVGENLAFLEKYITEHIPQIKVIPPEGTYLVWLDCRELGLDAYQLYELMLDKAGVYLSNGYVFGIEGEGFVRLNIACPRSILDEALKRIASAVKAL